MLNNQPIFKYEIGSSNRPDEFLMYSRICVGYSRIRQSPGGLRATPTLRAMKLNRAMIAKLNVMEKVKGLWRHFPFVEPLFG
jgi:hypothetical protein